MTPETRPASCPTVNLGVGQPPGRRAPPSEGGQGDEWAAYVTLDTYDEDERGIAYRARALWRRSAHSSRGGYVPPGRSGEPATGRRGAGGPEVQRGEVCVMQSAATVLDVIRKRGERELPLARLYRQLFNRDLFLMAYGRIYSNKGAMTSGVTKETVDGMSMEKIDAIIRALRSERYRWAPVKRVYIPKKNGKKRPLGLPTWSDKLVAEVVRLLLETYYEPQFSDHSHGFRPHRGRHTALNEIVDVWKGTHWFIEGDVSDCFGSLDHSVMLSILADKIRDSRFLRLISHMLKAGYLEDWKWNATLRGAPQGGVASPILSNIYLDRLDRFVEQQLLPIFNRGRRRRPDSAYRRIENEIAKARRHGDRKAGRLLRRGFRSLPSQDSNDPCYRRLRYVRYADDWLLGFAGPRREAEEIKSRIGWYLREELKLELSDDKTLITHAATKAARFLGYDIRAQHADTKLDRNGKRGVNGVVGLFVPKTVIGQRCSLYMSGGKPALRGSLLRDTDFSICHEVSGRVPGTRSVLPSRPGCVSSGQTPMGHGDLTAQDPGWQAPFAGHEGGEKVSC